MKGDVKQKRFLTPAKEKTGMGEGGNSKLIVCNSVYFVLAPINVYDSLSKEYSLAQIEEVEHGTVRNTTGEGNSLLSTSSLFPAGPAIMGGEEHQAASISPVT